MADNLACPFCGGSVDPKGWVCEKGFPHEPGEQVWGPECTDCGASAPSIELWNRRVQAQAAFLPIAEAAERASLGRQIANRLMDFPLSPQSGDTPDQHAACLQVAYAQEIAQALNERFAGETVGG